MNKQLWNRANRIHATCPGARPWVVAAACGLLAAPCAAPSAATLTVERGAQDPAVSPDGTTVAVGILGKIWLVPVSGGEARQLTTGTGWHSHPAWSKDARFLAYAYQRPTGTELIERSLATGTERTLFITKHSIGQIAYHPTRPELWFVEDRDQMTAHLWAVPRTHQYVESYMGSDEQKKHAGGDPRQLTFGAGQADWSFAISPDGRRVAVEHVAAPFPGARDLHVMNADGKDAERLTQSPLVDEFSVQWTSDGASLIYVSREEGVDQVTVRSLKGGATRVVFASPFDGKQLALHPDGETAVMVAGRQLFRLQLKSGSVTPIPLKARFTMPDAPRPDLVITNARLFDGTGRSVAEQANVEVKDGRVARVWSGPAVQRSSPANVPTIDARGRFLMAGLMDNHYHYWHHWLFKGADLVATGVTSIRDPGAQIADSLNLRDAIEHGLLAGPRIYSLGPLIDGYSMKPMVDVLLTKPEAAATLVRALHRQGVAGLKVYHFLAPDVLRAVVAEAKVVGLPVSGDIGFRTSWQEAIAAGIDGLNHGFNYPHGFLHDPWVPQWDKDPVELNAARYMQRVSHERVDPRSAEVKAMLAEMARRHVVLDPTLTATLTKESDVQQGGLDRLNGTVQSNADRKALTLEAYQAGIMLLAGTDNMPSLQDEMEACEQAGLPNAAILQMATVNGAKWLHKEKEFGTVEAGKRADLLLVDGDPLKQMKDIRNVALVVKDGRIVFEQ